MPRNTAFLLLLAAKAFGIVGLLLGMTRYRALGAALLGFDALILGVAISIAIRNARSERKTELTQKEILAQMVREGTLKQYLADIEAEKRQT